MLEVLSNDEKEVMFLLIQGHNYKGIEDYMCIDYATYKHIKKSLFSKLKITKTTKILCNLLQQGFLVNEL